MGRARRRMGRTPARKGRNTQKNICMVVTTYNVRTLAVKEMKLYEFDKRVLVNVEQLGCTSEDLHEQNSASR